MIQLGVTVMEMKSVKDEAGTECTTTAKSICSSVGLSCCEV